METHNKNKTSHMVWSRNPIAKRNAGKNSVILRDTKIPTSTGKTKDNMDWNNDETTKRRPKS